MEDLTGKQFGPYQIVAPLGEGGMAAVYKAYQPSMERYVAVKVLPRQMAESVEFIARFKREAHLLAQLQHPHILSVFDYGQSDGYTYIVMPFIQSGTLSDVLRKRHMTLPEIRRIMVQVGDALGYAHVRGMIHRDVKPSNVLIDERGNCLLTDFGLARMTDGTAKLTSSGAIMGTPAYMSPEQGAGKSLDGRSDIYSLGIIFYEMVTGQVPYQAETPIAIVFKHIQDPLPPARKFVPDLPEEVEKVLLKSLAKDPADRYQDAEDFVQAVQLAIPDQPSNKPIPVAPPVTANQTVISPPPSRPSTPVVPVTPPSQPFNREPSYPPPAARPRTNPPTAMPSQPGYRPASQPPVAPQRNNLSLWVLAGVGVIGVCAIGALLLVFGANYFKQVAISPTETQAPTALVIQVSITPAPTVTVELQSTPTLPPLPPTELPPPPLVPVPPGVKFARINSIMLNPQNQYVVEYETFEYKESPTGQHVHFFFDNVRLENAGQPGSGPWKNYGGPRPFTGYGPPNRPPDAALLCILVANPNHTILPHSGNCFPLPDVATATARENTACLDKPVETGRLIANFQGGMASRLLGFSSDKGWLLIQNPERENPGPHECWVPSDSSLIRGDTSHVPVVTP